MPSLILALVLVSLLLLGCGGVKERQERAADLVESAAQKWTVTLSGATGKVKATVSTVQEGAKKVTEGFSQVQEGVGEVKAAVTGE